MIYPGGLSRTSCRSRRWTRRCSRRASAARTRPSTSPRPASACRSRRRRRVRPRGRRRRRRHARAAGRASRRRSSRAPRPGWRPCARPRQRPARRRPAPLGARRRAAGLRPRARASGSSTSRAALARRRPPATCSSPTTASRSSTARSSPGPTRTSGRAAAGARCGGSADRVEDPFDVYRIRLPARALRASACARARQPEPLRLPRQRSLARRDATDHRALAAQRARHRQRALLQPQPARGDGVRRRRRLDARRDAAERVLPARVPAPQATLWPTTTRPRRRRARRAARARPGMPPSRRARRAAGRRRRRRRAARRGSSSCASQPTSRAAWRSRLDRLARRSSATGRRRSSLVGQRRPHALARGAEGCLVEDLRRAAPRPARRAASWQRQRVHGGGDGGRVARRDLRVQRADLDGPEPRMRAHLPPVEGVVGDLGDARQARGRALEVVEVGHRARHAGARPRAQRQLARGRQAGVAAVAKRRVGADRLEQRQVAAHAVEDADRGRRRRASRRGCAARRRASRRRRRAARGCARSARLSVNCESPSTAVGCVPEAIDAGAGREHRATQLAELGDGLLDGRADARDELDLAAVQLVLDLAALELAELLEHLGAGVDAAGRRRGRRRTAPPRGRS